MWWVVHTMGMDTNRTPNHPPTMTWETWRKMGRTGQVAFQAKCPHANVTDSDDVPRCDDCRAFGPWAGHATHGHFPNGQAV